MLYAPGYCAVTGCMMATGQSSSWCYTPKIVLRGEDVTGGRPQCDGRMVADTP
jgi:hypothetical protein